MAILIFRPSADTATKKLRPFYNIAHYMIMSDADDTTWCDAFFGVNGTYTDIYECEDSVNTRFPVNSVTIKIRAKKVLYYGSLKSNTIKYGIITWGNWYFTSQTLTTSIQEFSSIYVVNPTTGQPWTWNEINSLQLRIELVDSTDGETYETYGWASDIWIEVDCITHRRTKMKLGR
jgi:hypothetical protein